MTKAIFKPKKLERFTLEKYTGNAKVDLKDVIKDGALIRHYNNEDYVWSERAGTWLVLTNGDYVEQLPDGTFNRRLAAEVLNDMEVV